MWGRELRAVLIFVMASLAIGAAIREYRRSHERRFQDLVARLVAEDAASHPDLTADAPDSAGRSDGGRGRETPEPNDLAPRRGGLGVPRVGLIDVNRANRDE